MLSPSQLEDLEQTVGRVVIAYSGGCDSHVLLHYLSTTLRRSVEALHINHGLMPEADAWQAHCESICDDLNVPLTSFSVQVEPTGSLETNARNARYAVFERFLNAGDRLLFAHHQDDQTETLFLNLLSGRAPFGLLGMPEQRELGLGQIQRPLLGTTRKEILAYATKASLQWIEDPSNEDTRHERNRLRQIVLPNLREHYPDLDDRLQIAWQQTWQATQALAEQAQIDLNTVRLGPGVFDLGKMREFGKARWDGCLREMFAAIGYSKIPGRSVLTELQRVLQGAEPASFDLCSWLLQAYDNKLFVFKDAMAEATDLIPRDGLQIFSEGQLATNMIKGQGIGLPANQMVCRPRRGGESLRVRGHHHSLKNLLQEHRYPPAIRSHVPLLWFDDQCVGICGIPDWGIEMVISDQHRVSGEDFGCEFAWSPPGILPNLSLDGPYSD